MTTEIATIGFGKKGAARFIELLRSGEVETVVDTRRRPDSPLSGYARQRDLPYLLHHIAGIGYEHRPELAPPNELLDRYRQDKNWEAYVRDFEDVLSSADARESMNELLSRPDRVALLCSEPEPSKCHRRLVAERMQELQPELVINHLV